MMNKIMLMQLVMKKMKYHKDNNQEKRKKQQLVDIVETNKDAIIQLNTSNRNSSAGHKFPVNILLRNFYFYILIKFF